MRSTALSLLLISFFSVLCSAQTSQILFRSLDLADGLSQNSVVDIAQDSIGYLWFATQDGLNRYDGYQFHKYDKYFSDITRANNVQLGKLHVDHEGTVWSLPQSGIPEKYDSHKDKFQPFPNIKHARCISSDEKGILYFGTNNGLSIYNKEQNEVITPFSNSIVSEILISSSDQLFLVSNGKLIKAKNEQDKNLLKFELESTISPNSKITCLIEDTNNNIWAGTFGNGMYVKQKNTAHFSQIDLGIPFLKILSIVEDQQHNLWIGTYGSGAILFDPTTKTTQQFQPEKHNPNAIAYNDILSIFEDQSKNIWFGTDGGGLSFYDKNLVKFNGFTNSQIPSNIQIDVVRSLIVDNNENVWIGTSGKGLTRYSPNYKSAQWHTFTTQNSALKSNRIMSLEVAENDLLLIGTQGNGLNSYSPTANIFTSFNNPQLSKSTIWDIHRDKENRYWLATRNMGLLEFDLNKGDIITNSKNNSDLKNKNIRCIIDGASIDELWLGMENEGVALFNKKTNKLTHLKNPFGTKKIKSLYLSQDNILWIGTNGDGLKAYHIKTKTFSQFGTKDGLPNQVVYGIMSDKNNNLWLSTNQGICKFSPPQPLTDTLQQPSVTIYDNHDGLQSLEFNTGAYFKDRQGNFYFGGINGYNWFHPDHINTSTLFPEIILTEFSVNGKSMLEKIDTKSETSITLKHFQNDLSFSFATNNFSLPEKNKYRYQLIGYDESKQQTENRNFANYTNLSPGDYSFSIQASNYDGIWNETGKQFNFTIKPVWYKTLAAKLLFGWLFAFILLGIYLNRKRRWKLQAMLEKERQHAKHLSEMNEFKNEFYTNITHELRTPLTVIKGMSEEIRENDKAKNLISNNTNQLLQLVNQILDLSKLEHGHLPFNYIQQDVVVFLKYIASSFQSFAETKKIQLKFKTTIPTMMMDMDAEKLQQIISNLISNAIKFTKENGFINVNLDKRDNHLQIQISDSGIGIEKQNLPQIFERYYQVDPSNKSQIGTGIGLAYVKELIDKMQGEIRVESALQKGTTFYITLPITNEAPFVKVKKQEKSVNIISNNTATSEEEKPSILIIEDNKDVAIYLQTILQKNYTIEIQENGQEGIATAMKSIPDLIVSDVMMPIMDGLEVCDRLKNNELTSHIPIILLTAKASQTDKKSGLLKGADAYLVKPFDKEELLIRINQLLNLRKKMQEFYAKHMVAKSSEEIDSFLVKINESIEKHLGDEHFKTTQLCESVFFSKMQVYRKLKALTGQSTSEYLRNYRLQHGMELLKKGKLTVSEISDLTGFSSPAYFSRSFKETYHMTPSDYMNTYKSTS